MIPDSQPAAADALLDAFCDADAIRLRIAIVAAHPDDETIGAGARLALLGRAARLVHVTDGAPRDLEDARRAGADTWTEYAALRDKELDAALRIAGLGNVDRISMGVPDREATSHLPVIARRLEQLLVQTDVLVTHAYEGGHPDHDATACAVQAACERLTLGTLPCPIRLEFTSYHASANRLVTGEFLPAAGRMRTLRLSPRMQALKGKMLAAFASQQHTLRAFGVTHERFRLAPLYDFSRPPHEGILNYERFNRGTRGDAWRAAAVRARCDLGLS